MTALIYDIWSGFGTQAKPFVGSGRYAMGPPGVSHIWCDHLAPEIQPLSMIFKLSWIFSWAMSHIDANDEYRSEVGATNRPENIVIGFVSFQGHSP
jgi:hypothetical protein